METENKKQPKSSVEVRDSVEDRILVQAVQDCWHRGLLIQAGVKIELPKSAAEYHIKQGSAVAVKV